MPATSGCVVVLFVRPGCAVFGTRQRRSAALWCQEQEESSSSCFLAAVSASPPQVQVCWQEEEAQLSLCYTGCGPPVPARTGAHLVLIPPEHTEQEQEVAAGVAGGRRGVISPVKEGAA